MNIHIPPYTIGLDIGGTKIATLLVNALGQPVAQTRQPTPTGSPQALVDSIVQAIEDTLQQAQANPSHLAAIGIGIPGLVNPQTGVVQMAANLNLDNYPLGDALTAVFHTPTHIENDVRIAALGAYQYLHKTRPALQHIAYLSIGTGIAVGIVLNGRLHRGHNGMAGEIGHAISQPDGEWCKCGQRGCLETIAAGPAIARQAAALMPNINGRTPTTAEVYTAATQGNPIAQQIVQHVSQTLSHAIQWLIMASDVEYVVLGGGVAQAGPPFLQPIQADLTRYHSQSPLAQTMFHPDKLLLLPADYNAGAWGAIHLAQTGHPTPTTG
jgi:glucokinase